MTLVDSSVRKHIAGKTFQDLYSMDRGTLSDEVISDIGSHAMDEYGIRIKRIVINQPEASQSVKDQYDKVQSSAMAAQQAENDGKANYTREVKKAEAERQRDILRGEGAAGYRKKIFDQYNEQINELVDGGTPREEAVSVMMKIMQFDMLREVGEKGNLIIVTPDEAKGKELAQYQANARTVKPDAPGAAPAPALNS
jgi:regulator of protease activity HflC (stomatin/prohibitin superfamily)